MDIIECSNTYVYTHVNPSTNVASIATYTVDNTGQWPAIYILKDFYTQFT